MTNGFIDVHHHIIPEEYKAALAEAGIEKSGGLSIGSWSPQKSLALMDALGIEKAYCSLSEPALYPIVEKDRALGRQKARMQMDIWQSYVPITRVNSAHLRYFRCLTSREPLRRQSMPLMF